MSGADRRLGICTIFSIPTVISVIGIGAGSSGTAGSAVTPSSTSVAPVDIGRTAAGSAAAAITFPSATIYSRGIQPWGPFQA